MQESIELRLRKVIEKQLAANEARSDADIAIAVGEADAELLLDWAMERLAGLIGKLRQKLPDPDQLRLFPMELSARLPVEDGFIVTAEATMGKLKEAERAMEKRRLAAAKNPRPSSTHGRLRRLIEGMLPYSMANRRLTVERYYELRAQGVPPPVVTSHMSESMLRYWDSKTPEERSAIAYERKRIAAKKKAGAKKGSK